MTRAKAPVENRRMIGLAVQTPDQNDEDIAESLSELRELLVTAGYEMVASVVQKRPGPDRNSYFGKGKMDEVKGLIEENEAGGVVADDELSGLQARRLEEGIETRVSDRTGVILEIFAQHASTREGKLQVELARLHYRLLHLIGGYSALSRQRGGIGLKGPGETKIETDRRVLRYRIQKLNGELEQVVSYRHTQRRKRTEYFAPLFSLVGYTNAGKSTLLNAISGSEVQVHDGLFTTLDPTARRVALPNGRAAIVSDTVGFIRKLPHSLVQAFRATLEDVVNSQVVVLVTDVSHPQAEERIVVVRDVLNQIGVLEKEILMVFNKTDRAEGPLLESVRNRYPEAVFVSAREGRNLDLLRNRFATIIGRQFQELEFVMPADSPLVKLILQYGRVIVQEWEEGDVRFVAEVPPQLGNQLKPFVRAWRTQETDDA